MTTKEIDPTTIVECNWNNAIEGERNVNFIQIAVGNENFQSKLLNPPKNSSILLKQPTPNEPCTFKFELHPPITSVHGVKPVGWFLVTEARFIEIYIDKSYLTTCKGVAIVEETPYSPRNFPLYEHQLFLPEVKKFSSSQVMCMKFLGLPHDKSSLYISEWTVEVELVEEPPAEKTALPALVAGLSESNLLNATNLISKFQAHSLENTNRNESTEDSTNTLKVYIDQEIRKLKLHIDERLDSLERKLDLLMARIITQK